MNTAFGTPAARPPAPVRARMRRRWPGRVLAAALLLVALYGVTIVYAVGQTLLAGLLLVTVTLAAWTYGSARTVALRYLFPGVAAALVFVVFPMVYTVSIGFTNYSSRNLLDLDRARALLLEETLPSADGGYGFALLADGARVRLRLVNADDESQVFASPPLALAGPEAGPLMLQPAGADVAAAEPLPLKDVITRQAALKALVLKLPDGTALKMTSLRQFSRVQPAYRANDDGSLVRVADGQRLVPNLSTGFFETAAGEPVPPGFRVGVGFAHYTRIFTDPRFREPFGRIFVWTVAFSALTVLCAAGLGLLLAVLLNWEALRGRGVYRLVLFLPYAVPAFISILVFKGLFNQNLGEINTILNALFGIKPQWFADPWLAKLMLLIVNTWLGFPYMMVVCMGLIQAIPGDLYEASAVAGAGPLTNFFSITAPLIVKPLTPLLISSFAFNFNNFVLIALLTGGRPDFIDISVPAGATDILVSYTARIAFQDSGQQFGLASAISTVIFLLVAAITLLQMRFTRLAAEPAR